MNIFYETKDDIYKFDNYLVRISYNNGAFMIGCNSSSEIFPTNKTFDTFIHAKHAIETVLTDNQIPIVHPPAFVHGIPSYRHYPLNERGY